jgi:hypothetical protein
MPTVILRLLAVAGCVVLFSPLRASAPAPDFERAPVSATALPPVVAWAWERPADLRTLDARIGVAFHAQTIGLDSHGVIRVRPRRHPLQVGAQTRLIAVTRLESATPRPAVLTPRDLDQLATRIAGTGAQPQVVAVQVDFDAVASERPLYRRLLSAVRRRLPRHVPLSMTALASWCAGDRWLRDLPVDEIVPMLFRMGPDDAPYVGIASYPDATAPECRAAIGTSLDEPIPVRREGRRHYVFNAGPWTPATLRQISETIE